MALEDLAPELLKLIMEATESPRDLYRLISASPRLFQVFGSSPEIILSTRLKNFVSTDLLRHMLAVLHAPSRRSPAVDELTAFLDQYFDGTVPFELPTSKGDITALYRLYTRICYFSDDLFDKSMLGLGYDWTVAVAPPPSWSERTRIQRAFLRFELYCKVFPDGDTYYVRDVYTADQQSRLFLARLTPWEAEELTTVHQYFMSLVISYHAKLEEQFIQAVIQSPGVVLPPGFGTANGPQPGWHTNLDTPWSPTEPGGPVHLKPWDIGPLSWFCHDIRILLYSYISSFTSGGIDLIYEVSCADKVGDNMPFRTGWGTGRFRDFLPKALERARVQEPATKLPEYVGDNDPSHANWGYHLAAGQEDSDCYHLDWERTRPSNPLRALGYNFWDSERIETPTASGKVQEAMAMGSAHNAPILDLERRWSAEERLDDVKLPQQEWDRLMDEFGIIYHDEYKS